MLEIEKLGRSADVVVIKMSECDYVKVIAVCILEVRCGAQQVNQCGGLLRHPHSGCPRNRRESFRPFLGQCGSNPHYQGKEGQFVHLAPL